MIPSFTANPRAAARRRAFTLVELLITMVIISMMAGMILFAMFQASEAARVKKTEQLIARIDAVIKNKWESYRTRRVPIVVPPTAAPGVAARARIDALHDLMRMELPDRWTDVKDDPMNFSYGGSTPYSFQLVRPAVSQAFLRRYNSIMNGSNPPSTTDLNNQQGSECLYLILQCVAQDDGDDVSAVLKPENIRDTDGDGFPEIVDAWGTPIRFLRWPIGFKSELQVVVTGKASDQQTPAPNIPADGQTAVLDVVITYGNNPVPSGANTTPKMSTVQGSYVGGALITLNPDGTPAFEKMAPITNYQYYPEQGSNPAFARITFKTPAYTKQKPFAPGGGPPSAGLDFIIMAPDPFDHLRVYPIYSGNASPPSPDTSHPTFATYPLVFSAGPDKQGGIVIDFQPALHYNQYWMSPFTFLSDYKPIGYQDVSAGGFQDNIHNHQLGLR